MTDMNTEIKDAITNLVHHGVLSSGEALQNFEYDEHSGVISFLSTYPCERITFTYTLTEQRVCNQIPKNINLRFQGVKK